MTLPTWEEVNAMFEKADHDWCESLEAYNHDISVMKEGECVKITSREQGSTPKKGTVVEQGDSNV